MSNKPTDSSLTRTSHITSSKTRYKGSCYCGAVQFECGEPVRAPVCHCTGCQSLHGSPFVWSVVLLKEEFQWLQGYDDSIEKYQDLRYTCKQCHGKIADEGPKYHYSFPSLFSFSSKSNMPKSFQPTHHCFYGQRIMDVNDAMPKFVAKWGSKRLD